MAVNILAARVAGLAPRAHKQPNRSLYRGSFPSTHTHTGMNKIKSQSGKWNEMTNIFRDTNESTYESTCVSVPPRIFSSNSSSLSFPSPCLANTQMQTTRSRVPRRSARRALSHALTNILTPTDQRRALSRLTTVSAAAFKVSRDCRCGAGSVCVCVCLYIGDTAARLPSLTSSPPPPAVGHPQIRSRATYVAPISPLPFATP